MISFTDVIRRCIEWIIFQNRKTKNTKTLKNNFVLKMNKARDSSIEKKSNFAVTGN